MILIYSLYLHAQRETHFNVKPIRNHMKHSESQTPIYDPNREKTWCVQDQPTAKLASMGAKAVTDTELVAVLLNGTPKATT